MMGERYAELSALIGRVTRRWRTFTALAAWARAAAGHAASSASAASDAPRIRRACDIGGHPGMRLSCL